MKLDLSPLTNAIIRVETIREATGEATPEVTPEDGRVPGSIAEMGGH